LDRAASEIPHQSLEMVHFDIVHLQGFGQSPHNIFRYSCGFALLEAGVILHTDPGEAGYFVTPKARHTAAANQWKPRLLRGDRIPPCYQEVP
jgi:hypothetical protein